MMRDPSMTGTILDDLVFLPAPLDHRPTFHAPTISQQFLVGASQKSFQQAVPLCSLRPPLAATDPSWAAYCGLLKDLGIPLQASAAALEPLSISNVPIRMGKRACDEGFDLTELETADSIEINCILTRNQAELSRLPLETTGWHELKQLIESLRELAGPTTPIGLGMLIGDVTGDVTNAVAARADFVILHQTDQRAVDQRAATGDVPNSTSHGNSTSGLDLLAWSVVAARSAATQSGSPHFPIYVNCNIHQVDRLIKLIALGASAVSIDAIARATLAQSTPVQSNIPKGLLSGIGALPTRPVPTVEPLQRQLVQTLDQLRHCMQQQHVNHLHEFNSSGLRALGERAARLCQVKLL